MPEDPVCLSAAAAPFAATTQSCCRRRRCRHRRSHRRCPRAATAPQPALRGRLEKTPHGLKHHTTPRRQPLRIAKFDPLSVAVQLALSCTSRLWQRTLISQGKLEVRLVIGMYRDRCYKPVKCILLAAAHLSSGRGNREHRQTSQAQMQSVFPLCASQHLGRPLQCASSLSSPA